MLGLARFPAMRAWVALGMSLHLSVPLCSSEQCEENCNVLPSRGTGRQMHLLLCSDNTTQWGFHLGELDIRVIKYPGCPGSGVTQILE